MEHHQQCLQCHQVCYANNPSCQILPISVYTSADIHNEHDNVYLVCDWQICLELINTTKKWSQQIHIVYLALVNWITEWPRCFISLPIAVVKLKEYIIIDLVLVFYKKTKITLNRL